MLPRPQFAALSQGLAWGSPMPAAERCNSDQGGDLSVVSTLVKQDKLILCQLGKHG